MKAYIFQYFFKENTSLSMLSPLHFFLVYVIRQFEKRSSAWRVMKEGGGGGRLLIPFPSKLFSSNPSSNPTIPACVPQI